MPGTALPRLDCRSEPRREVGAQADESPTAGDGGTQDLLRELLETRRRFSLALRAAGAGAWEWNIETNETLWSDENYALLGLPVGDGKATYEEWFACVHPEDQEYARQQVEAAVRQRTDLDFEYRAVWPDGTTHWIHDIGKMMLGADGEAIGMFGIQMDVTEKRALEGQRENLIRELERRNAELERFAYTISHELAAPLVTIGGFLPYVRRSAAQGDLETLHGDLDRIERAHRRMAQLLSDLLELCRLGFRSNPAEEAPFAEVVRAAAAASRDVLQAAGLQLEMAEGLPVVRGDKPRLVEVMQNLLENAAHFTRRGVRPRVEVGVRTEAGKPVVLVRDNGIGIAPPLHEKVFDLFRKLDPEDPGTGVGLAIARRIIELHGGRIWVESRGRGRGSTFCIVLPWVGVQP